MENELAQMMDPGIDEDIFFQCLAPAADDGCEAAERSSSSMKVEPNEWLQDLEAMSDTEAPAGKPSPVTPPYKKVTESGPPAAKASHQASKKKQARH